METKIRPITNRKKLLFPFRSEKSIDAIIQDLPRIRDLLEKDCPKTGWMASLLRNGNIADASSNLHRNA